MKLWLHNLSQNMAFLKLVFSKTCIHISFWKLALDKHVSRACLSRAGASRNKSVPKQELGNKKLAEINSEVVNN